MAAIRTAKVDNGEGAYAFIAHPDDDKAYPGVVVIQEWWGIEPHVLDIAQRLAVEGFVVAVPDLYHGKVVTEPDEAGKMLMMLNVDKAIKEIVSTIQTLEKMSNVEPKQVGCIGFCMGGMLAYRAAEEYSGLGALVPFYPVNYSPTAESVAKVQAPILSFFGKKDPMATPAKAAEIETLYTQAGKNFQMHMYDAGHAFMNPTHGMGDAESAKDAWPKAVAFLKEHLH